MTPLSLAGQPEPDDLPDKDNPPVCRDCGALVPGWEVDQRRLKTAYRDLDISDREKQEQADAIVRTSRQVRLADPPLAAAPGPLAALLGLRPTNRGTMTVDNRWKPVTCSSCGRHYRCTPLDDYYNATTADDGVCERCLLHGAGYSDEDIARGHEQPAGIPGTRTIGRRLPEGER